VELDAAKDILLLIGSKEGLAHMPWAFIDPGDVSLVPDPAYTVYKVNTLMAGGEAYGMPLLPENGFLPDLTAIPSDVAKRAKLLFLNYPNNPTGAIATPEFFADVVAFAKEHDILVCHDAAYSEIYYEKKPMSFLEVPGAKEVGVEFHSLSKTYNMTGWRIGWVCGNDRVVKGLATVKDNYDSGVFQAIQEAAIAALTGPQDCVEKMRTMYRARRDVFVEGLQRLGWKVVKPKATFYVWAHVPAGYTSAQTVAKLLDEAGIVCTPGNGLGPSGEGYVRFALTVGVPRLREALKRMGSLNW
jgi:LL-diaminopimelate aminotransferase